jgi:hypothetical protein
MPSNPQNPTVFHIRCPAGIITHSCPLNRACLQSGKMKE